MKTKTVNLRFNPNVLDKEKYRVESLQNAAFLTFHAPGNAGSEGARVGDWINEGQANELARDPNVILNVKESK
jgi:hypothetical protein